MAEVPGTVLETPAALRAGMLVRAAGYDLEVAPRPSGADLAAGRDGTVWATFHFDMDRGRPLFLRVGVTVWGGARVALASDVAWAEEPDARFSAFVKERLSLACKRGREENPEHCATCPDASHRLP